ncbi:hypothetical protein IPJ72_05170 [Candidatus Peregrinibacteria bacterium]|nr:MAG: hypothetical protein IPJ72_05170 [Candidatus Peregrinibacteria bacterium]
MPEVFEPVKVTQNPESAVHQIEVNFSPENLGQLAKENEHLALYLQDQTDLVQSQLNAFKTAALKEYTGFLVIDNEAAVNQALKDYATHMNQLLEQSVSELQSVIAATKNEHPQWFKGDQPSDINARYAKVKEVFGPKLEAMIKGELNQNIADIINAADERASIQAEGERQGPSPTSAGIDAITGKTTARRIDEMTQGASR